MATGKNAPTGLRAPTGTLSPTDLSEAVRDIYARLDTNKRVFIEGLFSYVPPFALRCNFSPTAATLIRLRLADNPVLPTYGGMVAFHYDGTNIIVDGISGLTLATRYVMTFEVIG